MVLLPEGAAGAVQPRLDSHSGTLADCALGWPGVHLLHLPIPALRLLLWQPDQVLPVQPAPLTHCQVVHAAAVCAEASHRDCAALLPRRKHQPDPLLALAELTADTGVTADMRGCTFAAQEQAALRT